MKFKSDETFKMASWSHNYPFTEGHQAMRDAIEAIHVNNPGFVVEEIELSYAAESLHMGASKQVWAYAHATLRPVT